MKTEPTPRELELMRYLDGEMSREEHQAYEARLAQEPELERERSARAQSHSQLQEKLQALHRTPQDVPYPDFFMHRLQQGIEKGIEKDIAPAAESPQHRESPSFFSLGRLLPWAAAAGLAVCAYLAGQHSAPQPNTTTATALASHVQNLYTPNPETKVQSYYQEDAQALVLIVDNLDPLPERSPVANKPLHQAPVLLAKY